MAKKAAADDLQPQRRRIGGAFLERLVIGEQGFLIAARNKIRDRGSVPLNVVRRIKRIEPLCLGEMLQSGLAVADVGTNETTRYPGARGIRIEGKGFVDQSESVIDVAGHLRKIVACHPERLRIVLTG